MNLGDTVTEIFEIFKNIKSIDNSTGYEEHDAVFEIRKIVGKSLITQSNYCLDSIFKYKNQWDKTQPYSFLNDNKDLVDRVIQLIVNMSTDEIRDMIDSLEENIK